MSDLNIFFGKYLGQLERKYGPMPGKCRACGKCCRVIGLQYYKAQLQKKVREDRESLRKYPESAPRDKILLFIRDVSFITRYWRRVPREEAFRINPETATKGLKGRYFYRCTQLTPDGKCRDYSVRPQVCRGYPWYGSLPREDALVSLPCGYEIDLRWRKRIKEGKVAKVA